MTANCKHEWGNGCSDRRCGMTTCQHKWVIDDTQDYVYCANCLRGQEELAELPTIAPAHRPEWMSDQDWTEFIEWDRTIAAHYEVVIEPDYPSGDSA